MQIEALEFSYIRFILRIFAKNENSLQNKRNIVTYSIRYKKNFCQRLFEKC